MITVTNYVKPSIPASYATKRYEGKYNYEPNINFGQKAFVIKDPKTVAKRTTNAINSVFHLLDKYKKQFLAFVGAAALAVTGSSFVGKAGKAAEAVTVKASETFSDTAKKVLNKFAPIKRVTAHPGIFLDSKYPIELKICHNFDSAIVEYKGKKIRFVPDDETITSFPVKGPDGRYYAKDKDIVFHVDPNQDLPPLERKRALAVGIRNLEVTNEVRSVKNTYESMDFSGVIESSEMVPKEQILEATPATYYVGGDKFNFNAIDDWGEAMYVAKDLRVAE